VVKRFLHLGAECESAIPSSAFNAVLAMAFCHGWPGESWDRAFLQVAAAPRRPFVLVTPLLLSGPNNDWFCPLKNRGEGAAPTLGATGRRNYYCLASRLLCESA
jgi:hypothetical protein